MRKLWGLVSFFTRPKVSSSLGGFGGHRAASTDIEDHNTRDEVVNKQTSGALGWSVDFLATTHVTLTPLLSAEPVPTKKPEPIEPPIAIIVRWRAFILRSSSTMPRP